MEHQFVPRISLYRLQNAVFELRVHLHLPPTSHTAHLVAADVEFTQHGDCLLVSGNVPFYVGGDYYGHGHEYVHRDKVVSQGTLVWTDQPCGRFGRSVPIGLSPGTEYIILERRIECGDYVMRYTLRNTPGFVGNICTSDVPQHQLRADAGFDLSARVSPQAALDVSYLPGTNTGGVNAGFGLSAGASTNLGFSAGTGVNVGLGGAGANVSFNVGGSASGTAGLATVQTAQGATEQAAQVTTAQITQELKQSATQHTTQTAAELDVVSGNKSGQGTIAGSSGQYGAGFVSGKTQGQPIGVTILAGSEDVQLGSVVKGQVGSGSTQGVGQVTIAGSSGQYGAGFVSGQTQWQATGVTTLAGSKDVQLGSVVTSQVASGSAQGIGQVATTGSSGQYNVGLVSGRTQGKASGATTLAESEDVQLSSVVTSQVASGSTQGVGQVSSVQQTTQVAAEQATQVTAGQITQETKQSSIQGQVSTETIQSSTQQTTQTVAELNAESANTSGLVNVAGSSGQYVTTDQAIEQTAEAVTQKSAQTSKVSGVAKNTGSRQVAWESTRGVAQSSSVEQTTKFTSEQIAQASADVTAQSSIQQSMQTSTELETRNTGGLVTVAGSSVHSGGQVLDQTEGRAVLRPVLRGGKVVHWEPEQGQDARVSAQGVTQSSVQQTTQLSSQQIAQVFTEETAQSSTQQTTQASAELDVRKGSSGTLITVAGSSRQDGGGSVQTRGETVGVTILNGDTDVQHRLETRLEGWESTQGIGQVTSAPQATQSSSQQVAQASTETAISSTQQTEQISTELGVRTGNTGGIVTVAESSEQYDGGASVQTQETVGIAVVQSGEDVYCGSVTGRVSTQGVIQSSSAQQTIQSSSEEITQSSTQQTTVTSAGLGVDIETSGTSVTVAGSSGEYRGGVSVETQGQAVSILQRKEGAQRGSVTGQVAWVSSQGTEQSSSVQQTAQSSSQQILQVSTDETAQFSSQQTTQTSPRLDVGTRCSGALVTVEGTFEQYDGEVSVQTQGQAVGVHSGSAAGQVAWESSQGAEQSSSMQQTIQNSSQQILQVSTDETTQTSAGLDVGIKSSDALVTVGGTFEQCDGEVSAQTQGQAVGVAILQGREEVRGSVIGQVAWESSQGAEQLSSVQQTNQSSSQQTLRTEETTQSTTQQTTQTSAGLDVGFGSSSTLVNIAGSQGSYGGVSAQTHGDAMGVTILQSGEDIQGGSTTHQVAWESTQGVGQLSSVTQSSSQEIAQVTTEGTTQSSSQQIAQTSTEQSTDSAYGQLTQLSTAETTESASQQIAQVSTEKTTTSTSQQIVQVSAEEKMQSSSQQAIQGSADIDVRDSGTLVITAESSGKFGGEVSEQGRRQTLDVLQKGLDVQQGVSASSVETDPERIARDIQTSMTQDIRTSTQQITESSVQAAAEESSIKTGATLTRYSDSDDVWTGDVLPVSVVTQEVTQVMTQGATQSSTQQLTQQESDVQQQSMQCTSLGIRLGGAVSVAGPYTTVVEAAEDSAVMLVQGAAGSYSRGTAEEQLDTRTSGKHRVQASNTANLSTESGTSDTYVISQNASQAVLLGRSQQVTDGVRTEEAFLMHAYDNGNGNGNDHESRSTSSAHTEPWDVVSGSVSVSGLPTLTTTLHAPVSTGQIQTGVSQTQTFSAQTHTTTSGYSQAVTSERTHTSSNEARGIFSKQDHPVTAEFIHSVTAKYTSGNA